jgi:DNA-binding XRE family transcriptional regulator
LDFALHPQELLRAEVGQPKVLETELAIERECRDLRRGRVDDEAAYRQRREMTLADLSSATDISLSTLSRLESGQRRPNLELLLPLARALRVPLDELVGAPATGDPSTRSRSP